MKQITKINPPKNSLLGGASLAQKKPSEYDFFAEKTKIYIKVFNMIKTQRTKIC